MNFLSLAGLGFAAFLPAIVVLYLLKLKRIDHPIASTLLWRQSLEDLKANTPFQKLKQNLLLYLQLLIMTLLVLAAARPVLELGGLRGQNFVVMIDHSASMSATDGIPTRLDEAKALAIDVVNDMSMGDRMMVVSFGANAQVLSPFESNKGMLRTIIESIQPSEDPTNINEALRIAESAAEVQPNVEAILLSDGRFSMPELPSRSPYTLRYIPMGTSNENVGVVELIVRKDFSTGETYQILAGIENTGITDQSVFVEMYGRGTVVETSDESTEAEPQLIDARMVDLAAGEYQQVIFTIPATIPREIQVHVDSDDPFPLDNQAVVIVEPEETVSILLVSLGNFFLESVLNIDPRVRLTSVTPTEYSGTEGADIVVFDANTPEVLPEGNYIFINQVPPLPGWSFGETMVEYPFVVDYDRFHPLTRYVQFDNMTIASSLNIDHPEWAQIILESRETSLIVAFEDEKIRGVVSAFDVFDSDWRFRVSFPLFFSNAIDWLLTSEDDSLMKQTGEVLALMPPQNLEDEVMIVPPAPEVPETFVFTDDSPIYFDRTHRQGIYEYRIGDTNQRRYAVNLLSSEESTIAPVRTISVGNTEIVGETAAVESNQEIWRWLVLLGMIILAFEWWVYVKRARYSF